MFHNMKADIIYYKTATDFELEFNLCGCCRMRLLSDKTPDKKSFVLSLARAVSRSNVILIAGALFGEDNSIKAVTEAIDTTTEIVDNAAFGISGDQEIEIIKGSTPLVTPEGYFGGCIIESGPQTMIILTDNKSVRKTIMKTLIHPYIEELYASELAAETQPPETDEISNNEIIVKDNYAEEEPIEITENQNLVLEQEDYEAETISEEDINLSKNIVLETEDPTQAEQEDEEKIDLFFEPTKLDRRTVERFTHEYMSNNTDYHEEEDYYRTNNPSVKNGFSLAVFIISIILLLVLVVLCYCIFFVPSNQGIAPAAYLREIFDTMFG